MDEKYKIDHENFVRHLNGTTPEEVLGLSLIGPISSILLLSLVSSLPALSRSWRIQILVEYVVLVLPMLLAFTVWSEHIYLLVWSLLVAGGILVLTKWNIRNRSSMNKVKYKIGSSNTTTSLSDFISRWSMQLKCKVPFKSKDLSFISAYRYNLLQSTAIAILAVDFPVFPRRFAKTETYGWSPMDIGVGSFVMANAVVSPHSKGKVYNQRIDPIVKSLVSSSPMLFLGIVRVAAIKAIGYPEHVTEYGIHWNFFFTLALTKIACTTLFLVPLCSSGLYALITGVFYQILLSYWHFNEMLLSDDRNNIIEANKEGLCSLFGYMTLYFAGVEIGKFIHQERHSFYEWLKCSAVLFIIGFCTWVLMYLVVENVEQVSRRMANLPYCLWMVSVNVFQLCLQILVMLSASLNNKRLHCFSDGAHRPVPSCPENSYKNDTTIILWEAVDRNALFYFLFSNVLTGIVNLSIQTINSSPQTAVVILVIYIMAISATSAVLSKYSIKTKVW